MANKIFNGRIVQKHDSEENWNKASNFAPLEGELIIVHTSDGRQRFKVGKFDADLNRLLYYSELPFTDENNSMITITRWVT